MCRPITTLFLVLCMWFANGHFALAQVVPGFDVAEFASVTDPLRIAFDSSGVLFTGRDNQGSGGGPADAVRIHRIGIGGSPVVEYGNADIIDPDAVIVDENGIFGTPGAIIVGGQISNPQGGQIWAVLPNENVVSLFGPTTDFHNPSDFVFDDLGRLLFTNFVNPGTSMRGVYVTTGPGDTPSLLFATSQNVGGIAIDPTGRIFVTTIDGRVEIHESNGTLVENSFVSGLGTASLIAFGQFGTDDTRLFTINSNGEMLRINELGAVCVIGTGFVTSSDIVFGPDGAMYVAEFGNDRVLRITQSDFVLGDLNGDNIVNLLDVAPFVEAISMGIFVPEADINGDGLVDLLDVAPFVALLICG